MYPAGFHVPSSSYFLLCAPALLVSIVLLMYLCRWHGCLKLQLALHLEHHLLLIDAMVCQLLLELVIHHGQLLVGGCEPVDGGLCHIVRGGNIFDSLIK